MADLMGEEQIKVLMDRHVTHWPDGGYTINRGDMLAFAKELMSALHPAGFVLVDALALRELRMELDALGEQIAGVVERLKGEEVMHAPDLDDVADELAPAGKRLQELAGVCGRCQGEGHTDEGDPEVGSVLKECTRCCGDGFTCSFPPPSSVEREAADEKQAAEYQAWLDTPDGQAAVAAAMQPQETPHG